MGAFDWLTQGIQKAGNWLKQAASDAGKFRLFFFIF